MADGGWAPGLTGSLSSFATGNTPKLLPGGPTNLGQMLFGLGSGKGGQAPTEHPGTNTTEGATQPGEASQTKPPGFWQKPGGQALSSLAGIAALGGLGAAIGGVSGGGRGALRGLSYGAGTGALQDLELRKAGAQIPANVASLELEKADRETEAYKAQSELQKGFNFAQGRDSIAELNDRIAAIGNIKNSQVNSNPSIAPNNPGGTALGRPGKPLKGAQGKAAMDAQRAAYPSLMNIPKEQNLFGTDINATKADLAKKVATGGNSPEARLAYMQLDKLNQIDPIRGAEFGREGMNVYQGLSKNVIEDKTKSMTHLANTYGIANEYMDAFRKLNDLADEHKISLPTTVTGLIASKVGGLGLKGKDADELNNIISIIKRNRGSLASELQTEDVQSGRFNPQFTNSIKQLIGDETTPVQAIPTLVKDFQERFHNNYGNFDKDLQAQMAGINNPKLREQASYSNNLLDQLKEKRLADIKAWKEKHKGSTIKFQSPLEAPSYSR